MRAGLIAIWYRILAYTAHYHVLCVLHPRVIHPEIYLRSPIPSVVYVQAPLACFGVILRC